MRVNTDLKNSEYGHFSSSVGFRIFKEFDCKFQKLLLQKYSSNWFWWLIESQRLLSFLSRQNRKCYIVKTAISMMVNNSYVFVYNIGYDVVTRKESIWIFLSPFGDPELLRKCFKFVNRNKWTQTNYLVVFFKHFKGKLIFRSKKWKKLIWKVNSNLTILNLEARKRPSGTKVTNTSP